MEAPIALCHPISCTAAYKSVKGYMGLRPRLTKAARVMHDKSRAKLPK